MLKCCLGSGRVWDKRLRMIIGTIKMELNGFNGNAKVKARIVE
jgi:hypothetical protein